MIVQKLRAEMMEAMKAKDALKLSVLRGAITAFTNELVTKGQKPTDELSDADALTVLKRMGKQRKDSIEQFTKGNRPELAEKEAEELKIIESYLPQMASREEIERVAKAKKDELGVTDASGIGKLTGAIMKELGGNVDGNDVKEVLKGLFV